MNQEAVFLVCGRIESISYFPICCFNREMVLYPSMEDTKKTGLFSDQGYAQSLIAANGLIQESDMEDVWYYISHYEPDLTVMIGPLCTKTVRSELQRKYCMKHQLPLTSAPIRKASLAQIRNAVLIMNDLFHIHGFYETVQDVFLQENEFASTPEDYHRYIEEQINQLFNHPESAMEAALKPPEYLQNDLMEALKNDDQSRFFDILQKLGSYQSDTYAYDPLKLSEYGAVMMISSMSQAAIEGGVPYYEAQNLRDTLLYSLSKATSSKHYGEILNRAISQFMSRIHLYKEMNSDSAHVRRCISFIESHLDESLSPDIIADHLHLSSKYLQHIFTAEMKTSLMKYVTKKRIEAATKLLAYTDASILEIAFLYQFKTQSHFARVFRESTGMTPSQYRSVNRGM